MNPQKLSNSLSVSAQIAPDDAKDIAAMGFKSVICNRPDGEGFDQPAYQAVADAAAKAGLTSAYQPVVSGSLTMDDVVKFDGLLKSLPKPILAYCRSGARCTMLYNMAQSLPQSAAE